MIEKIYNVPTGHIVVIRGYRGLLELMSIGDYGKEVNLNQDTVVPDGLPMMPLTKKWVVTISTQYGCSMGCSFCDVPKVGPGKNASLHDLQQQILAGLAMHPEVTRSERLNVHYARMGEPTWNPAVLDHAKWMKEHIDPEFMVHPVVSTMMPVRNEWLKTFIHTWARIKNRLYRGNAGLQLSINSTCEAERTKMFRGNCCSLLQISRIMEGCVPVGRKYTLNFPVAGWEIDPQKLLQYFDPERFIVKLTPMHETVTAKGNGLETEGDYTKPEAYQEVQERLEKAGYEVLVFIASRDEDLGMITCGNAVLTGREPERLRTGELLFQGAKDVR
jgi:23S rRNA (adenine2503-C2)-methyltransferase